MALTELLSRLLLATALGAALGMERELRRKPAGLRTNILIALGSAIFTIVSIEFGRDGGTPDRIASQIVTGVGFLGGGAILRRGVNVRGMTTAVTVWVNAAIGMAAGGGYLALATIGTILTLFVLAVLPAIESGFERRAGIDYRTTHPERRDKSGKAT